MVGKVTVQSKQSEVCDHCLQPLEAQRRLSTVEKQLKQAMERLRWRPISEIHEDNGDHIAFKFGKDGEAGDPTIVHNCNLYFDQDEYDICVPVPRLTQEEVERLLAEINAAKLAGEVK